LIVYIIYNCKYNILTINSSSSVESIFHKIFAEIMPSLSQVITTIYITDIFIIIRGIKHTHICTHFSVLWFDWKSVIILYLLKLRFVPCEWSYELFRFYQKIRHDIFKPACVLKILIVYAWRIMYILSRRLSLLE
jgi:hypothetical protein